MTASAEPTAAPAAPAVPTSSTTLSLAAPDGAEWSWEVVKTAGGTKELGSVPILVWRDFEKFRQHYGDAGVLDMSDGTSLRVSFQSIARRNVIASKSYDDMAKAQIDFRPGRRGGAEATPQSRAAKLARTASEKVTNKAALEAFLAKVASGDISDADLEALAV